MSADSGFPLERLHPLAALHLLHDSLVGVLVPDVVGGEIVDDSLKPCRICQTSLKKN